MKKSFFILALCLCFSTLKAQEQTLKPLLAEYGIPGIQLVCIKGNQVQNVYLGVISRGSAQKVASNTIFEAASLSKCVFAYAVLRLSDRGILNLDTPLIHYVGSYERFDSKDPRYGRITARMVLRHTSGLPNWGDEQSAKLLFTPDSTYSYSGEGYQYLQRVVEKLTGKTLDALAQQEVFTPLGMTNSSYTWQDKFGGLSAFGNSPEAVSGHKKQQAAASLLTCAHDYALFLQAVMTGKGLKPQTLQIMLSKQTAANWFGHRLKEANKHVWWGLGMALEEDETGIWAWQWGDNGDFKNFCIVNPAKKEALVYFTHSNWGLHITTDILNAFFSKQTWWSPQWNGYQFDEKPSMLAFWAQLDKQGYDHATEIAQTLKQQDTAFNLPEGDVNDLGGILQGKGMKKEAIAIFQFNIMRHPESGVAYDSLAEVYDEMNEKELAIKYYKKSIELNPNNTYGMGRVKKLESEMK